MAQPDMPSVDQKSSAEFLPKQSYSQTVLDLPEFQYKKLEPSAGTFSIRLLEVLNYSTHGLVTCRLHHVPSSSPYDALSYTWGEPLAPENAFWVYLRNVDDSPQQDDAGIVLIRESLHGFLKLIAASGGNTGRLIWIDALCINQNDLPERNEQVSHMGTIYRQAKSVNIWGLDVDPRLTDVVERYCGHVSHSLPDATDDLADELVKTIGIEEEVLLASSLSFYCGSTLMDWSILERLHAAAQKLENDIQMDSFQKLQQARINYGPDRGFPYLDIAIEFSWESGCSEICDRVYGLLSLTQDGQGFRVDYSEDKESLLLRALHYFRIPHVSRFLEFAHKLVQLLELDYRTIYDWLSLHSFEAQYCIPAQLAVLWAPPWTEESGAAAKVICSACNTTIKFDGNIAKVPPRLFCWCPDLGYNKSERLTHVIFRHVSRRSPRRSTASPGLSSHHADDESFSKHLGMNVVKKWWKSRNDGFSTTTSQQFEGSQSRTDSGEAGIVNQNDEWRHLRAIGWKMSDATAWESPFFSLDGSFNSDGQLHAMIEPTEGGIAYQSQYNSTIFFSAPQLIRFAFFVKMVPFDPEGWMSNYAFEALPSSMYPILNPDTRVHLQHRDFRVRQRTNIEDYRSDPETETRESNCTTDQLGEAKLHAILQDFPNQSTTGDSPIGHPQAADQQQRLGKHWQYGRRKKFQLPQPKFPGEGHEAGIYAMHLISPFLVSGSRDTTIRVWDLETLRLRSQPLRGHSGSVLCLQFDPRIEHDIIISGGADSNVFVWKFSTGEMIRKIEHAHSGSVLDLSFNDQYLVTCSKDKTVKVWNRTASDNGSMVVINNLETPLTSGIDGYVEAFTLMATSSERSAGINSVAIHNTTIVSGSGDCTTMYWNIDTGVSRRIPLGHTRGITCLQFDGRYVVSSSSDCSIRIWDMVKDMELACIFGHAELVRDVQARLDSLNAVKILDLHNATSSEDTEDHQLARIVSGSYDGTVILWEPDVEGIWRPILRLRPNTSETDSVNAEGAGQSSDLEYSNARLAQLNATMEDVLSSMQVLRDSHHQPHHQEGEKLDRIFKVQFDSRYIVCCGQNRVITGWDFANGE